MRETPSSWAVEQASSPVSRPNRPRSWAANPRSGAGGTRSSAHSPGNREALLAAGREEEAAALERGFDGASACGARREGDRAATLLRQAGRTARAPASDGAGGLSAREREVADLVVERLTNREIAARLYLSEKTIERHLASAFRKLGVSSRVELARAVERGLG